jgi:hypothetical protein
MREQRLVARAKRRRRSTTRPGKGRWRAPDLVGRNFPASTVNQKWYGDGTEIVTDEGKLHLASVLDMASRRLVGFALSDHHDAELAHAALAMAVAVRGGKDAVAGVILHTDGGSEGGFNWSSQRLDAEELRWRLGRGSGCVGCFGRRCGRLVGRRWRGVRIGSGSGGRSRAGCPVRTPVWRPVCRRRWDRGSVRVAGCCRSVWPRCRVVTCRSRLIRISGVTNFLPRPRVRALGTRSARPVRQARGQLPAQRPTPLNRAPRPGPAAVRPPPVPATDPAHLRARHRRPARSHDRAGEPVLHVLPQRVVRSELGRLRAPGTSIGMPLRRRGTIVQATGPESRRCASAPARPSRENDPAAGRSHRPQHPAFNSAISSRSGSRSPTGCRSTSPMMSQCGSRTRPSTKPSSIAVAPLTTVSPLLLPLDRACGGHALRRPPGSSRVGGPARCW